MAQRAPLTTDPHALAALVRGLGGTVIPGRTFMFDLPASEIKSVADQFDNLHLGIRRISERVEEDPIRLGKNQGVVTLEVFRRGDT